MKGKHLIVDMHDCRMPNHAELYEFIDELVKLIKMNKLISPYVVKGAPDNPGITGFVIIETSHIAIHTFEDTNTIALDIYSCKPFNHIIALNAIKKTFETKKITYKVYRR